MRWRRKPWDRHGFLVDRVAHHEELAAQHEQWADDWRERLAAFEAEQVEA